MSKATKWYPEDIVSIRHRKNLLSGLNGFRESARLKIFGLHWHHSSSSKLTQNTCSQKNFYELVAGIHQAQNLCNVTRFCRRVPSGNENGRLAYVTLSPFSPRRAHKLDSILNHIHNRYQHHAHHVSYKRDHHRLPDRHDHGSCSNSCLRQVVLPQEAQEKG